MRPPEKNQRFLLCQWAAQKRWWMTQKENVKKENLIPFVVVVQHTTVDATNRCQALPARGKGTKTILSFKVSLHAICKGTISALIF